MQKNSKNPRFTIIGAQNSVPRITLVSKQGEEAKHVSLYNRYGKFGIFSGVLDNSIFHITADGSEVLMTTKNVQPHFTIESSAKGASAQELILKGADAGLKMFHKNSNLGFCNLAADGKKCDSFLQATTNGETTDFISQTDKAALKVSHKIRGGNSELQLISQDAIGDVSSTDIYNDKGTIGLRSAIKNVKKDLLTITPAGEAKFHGKLDVTDTSNFQKDATFAGNVDVTGVVTMSGKSVNLLFEQMESTKRENMMMRKRLEDMDDDTREMRNRMTEMEQTNTLMREKMERMMSTLALMQETSLMKT